MIDIDLIDVLMTLLLELVFDRFGDLGLFLFIAFDVALEFLRPEFHVGFRHCGDFATFMAMPEATVDENHRMPFGQNDIGMSGQFR